jgi:hypothetical protein
MGRRKDPASVQSQARNAGLSEFAVYDRLKRGWDLARALSTPVPVRGIPVSIAARAAGMKPDTVRHRMRRRGLSVAQATHPYAFRRRRLSGRAFYDRHL